MSKKIFLFLFILLTTVSCVETVVVGTFATGLYVNKKFFDTSNDKAIKDAVLKSFKAEGDKLNYKDVRVNVYGGRIMLTGYVLSAAIRNNVAKKAEAVKLGNEVINELIVSDNYNISSVKDGMTSGKIYSRLKYNKIDLSTYEYDIVNGKVYILGAAKSDDEMKDILDIVRRTSGVKKVVSYILIAY